MTYRAVALFGLLSTIIACGGTAAEEFATDDANEVNAADFGEGIFSCRSDDLKITVDMTKEKVTVTGSSLKLDDTDKKKHDLKGLEKKTSVKTDYDVIVVSGGSDGELLLEISTDSRRAVAYLKDASRKQMLTTIMTCKAATETESDE